MGKENQKPSEFLTKLQRAIKTGNMEIATDEIKRLNEVHRMANKINPDAAESRINKRIEDAGGKLAYTEEERKQIDEDAKKAKLIQDKEDEKYAMISGIENLKKSIVDTKLEKEELEHILKKCKGDLKTCDKIIESQKIDLEELEKRFKEEYPDHE